MNSDMESFALIDDNAGSNPPIQSTHRSLSTMQLPYDNSVAVYKPLMPGASSPPPSSSPVQVYPPLKDDSILDLTHLHKPDIVVDCSVEPTKRKRGRPRKYAPDGKVVPGFRCSSSQRLITSTPSGKKRGRPVGSSRKYPAEIGSSSNGSEFTPHIITANAGEDISSKIRSVAQSASQTVCVISANGEISSVTICRALTCGGTITYEGRFHIINLSGYYTFSESVDQHTTTGGLTILLSGSDGQVLGGTVLGALIAASSVQVVVATFIPVEEEMSKNVKETEVNNPSKVLTGTWSVGSPLSRGTMSECSGGPGSPFNLSSGVCNNNMQQDLGTISWK